MTIKFERPVGAAADVHELEYVSALHQTDLNEMRMDGSIRDEDIVMFLSSRYGIKVTGEEVRSTIIHGLGGGVAGDDCLDLVEMVSILLIPSLLKAAFQELSEEPLSPEIIKPANGLLDYTLSMILHDVTGNHSPKVINPDLIKKMFVSYGETELAEDDKLIAEMMAVATDPAEHKEAVRLNLRTFARVLTSDVQLYDINNETRKTTNYDDVFLTKRGQEVTEQDVMDENIDSDHFSLSVEEMRQRKLISKPINRVFTAPAIDSTAGTYNSKMLITLLWATVIVTYFAYYHSWRPTASCDIKFKYVLDKPWSRNSDAIACEAGLSILTWIARFWTLSVFGWIFVGIGSVGNHVQCRRFWKPLIGCAVTAILVLATYNEEPSNSVFLSHVSLILGLIACVFHLHHAMIILIPRKKLLKVARVHPALGRLVTGSAVAEEVQIKKATANKLHKMTKNALDIVTLQDRDFIMDTHYGQALFNFNKAASRQKMTGGFIWAWKRFLTGEAISKDGIWFSERLLANNVSQYIVAVYVLLLGIATTNYVSNNYDKETAHNTIRNVVDNAVDFTVDEVLVDDLSADVANLFAGFIGDDSVASEFNCTDYVAQGGTNQLDSVCNIIGGAFECDPNANVDYLCALVDGVNTTSNIEQLGILGGAGFNVVDLREAVRLVLQDASDTSIENLYPAEKFMVEVPFMIGTVVAFLVALYLAMVFFPSVTSTMLKLRTGVIPTLRNKEFNRYRVAADQVTILTGSLFWGCFASSITVGGIVGLIVFVFLWQATVYFVQRFIALAIGIIAITIMKMLLLLTCRTRYYKAFYRKKPFAANVAALALEWANFSLSAGFIFLRLVKLLMTAAVYIGRIDTPFLAPGVGRVGPVELDNYPHVFLKDVLSHEAHRHPYIELMGVMYLMKLRYGDNFGSRAGGCWRLLFVHALMPWLQKYRVLARPELLANGSNALLSSRVELESKLRFMSVRNVYSSTMPTSEEMADPFLSRSLRAPISRRDTMRRRSTVGLMDTLSENDNQQEGEYKAECEADEATDSNEQDADLEEIEKRENDTLNENGNQEGDADKAGCEADEVTDLNLSVKEAASMLEDAHLEEIEKLKMQNDALQDQVMRLKNKLLFVTASLERQDQEE